MMQFSSRSFFLFALVGTQLFSQTKDQLLPIDESSKDKSFFAFKTKLLQAIADRDAVALLDFVAPKIRTSFGAGGGRKEFGSYWKLDKPKKSLLWAELGDAVKLGVARMSKGDGYAAPYVYATFPDQYDPFEHVAVVRADAKLYAQPDRKSAVVQALRWDILKRAKVDGQAPTGWVKVQTLPGISGWVQACAIRSPIDYRALFQKSGGKWLMVAFVKGD